MARLITPPLQGEAPTIDLVWAYNKSKPQLNRFLATQAVILRGPRQRYAPCAFTVKVNRVCIGRTKWDGMH
jgi:hypothetical protein